jgi:hypothetical protein
MRIQLRRAAAGLLAFAALLGGATVGIAQATDAGHAHASTHHKKKHHRHHHHSKIPQHNGGDHDSDNNGGPSDGDGNV